MPQSNPQKMNFGISSNSSRRIETGVFCRNNEVDKTTNYKVSRRLHASQKYQQLRLTPAPARALRQGASLRARRRFCLEERRARSDAPYLESCYSFSSPHSIAANKPESEGVRKLRVR